MHGWSHVLLAWPFSSRKLVKGTTAFDCVEMIEKGIYQIYTVKNIVASHLKCFHRKSLCPLVNCSPPRPNADNPPWRASHINWSPPVPRSVPYCCSWPTQQSSRTKQMPTLIPVSCGKNWASLQASATILLLSSSCRTGKMTQFVTEKRDILDEAGDLTGLAGTNHKRVCLWVC